MVPHLYLRWSSGYQFVCVFMCVYAFVCVCVCVRVCVCFVFAFLSGPPTFVSAVSNSSMLLHVLIPLGYKYHIYEPV
jgi:hypothetical protein